MADAGAALRPGAGAGPEAVAVEDGFEGVAEGVDAQKAVPRGWGTDSRSKDVEAAIHERKERTVIKVETKEKKEGKGRKEGKRMNE